MKPFTPLSNVDQLVAHLKAEIRDGSLSGTMPGIAALVETLGIGTKTAVAALKILEQEGLTVAQGMRRGRKIVLTEDLGVRPMRVGLLLYSAEDAKSHYILELLHRTKTEGHFATVAPKTMVGLGMDVNRIARFVASNPADAWVVFSGSLDVLQWFAAQDTPSFAFAGRRRNVQIASSGPDKQDAIRTAVRRLVELGHRRIVMLAREERRKPHPGAIEQAFLDELLANGIPTGDYNLPGWNESPEGLRAILDSLFMHSPPTALIIKEPATFVAAQNYLAQLNILAPRDISLICDENDPAFAWCRPSVAHIQWNASQCVLHIVRWINSVARGNARLRHSFTKAEFVEGGTVGPARKVSR